MAVSLSGHDGVPVLERQSSTEEEHAAQKIQAIARGQLARNQVKDQRLWHAWNELDQKEEAELMASHQQYEDLKADLKRKKSGLGHDDGKSLSPVSKDQVAVALEAKRVAAANAKAGTLLVAVPGRNNSAAAQSNVAAVSQPAIVAPASVDSATQQEQPQLPSPSGKTYLIRTKSSPKKEDSSSADSSNTSASTSNAASVPTPSVVTPIPIPIKRLDDDGLTLTDPIQLDFVTAMMDHFKFNKMLDLANVVELLRRVKGVLKIQPNCVDISVATRLTIVGDLHGQLDDLFAIFKLNGLPSPRNAYIFNGDFVDRGQYSCECVLVLFAFKLLYPKSMHLNRGNHEARDINSRDGFEKECLQKYNHAVFDLFSDVFACLPLAAVVNHQIFVVHGGLASADFTLQQLQEVDRFHEIPPGESLQEDILWSDPDDHFGRRSSPRGAGLTFGADVTHAWLHANHMRLIIRSHECQQRGYAMHHGDTIITVFSASNYCGTVNNEGSFIILEKDLIPRIVPFFAKPKERLSRYRMRHAVMENDIISKLLQRIADNRLALTNYYSAPNVSTMTSAGIRTDYLGLPKLGVDGKKKGDIDFQAFLLRFRPVNAMLDPSKAVAAAGGGASPVSPGGRRMSRSANENVVAIMEMLAKHKYELESLFRHFDLNGDESISVSEFREGVTSLQSLLGFEFAPSDLDSLLEHIDTNRDGCVSYTEFFAGFKLADPQLGDVQRKAAMMVISRNKTGSGVPPSQTPSPSISPRTLAEHKQLAQENSPR